MPRAIIEHGAGSDDGKAANQIYEIKQMMSKAEVYRENARNCAELAAENQSEPTRKRYRRMEAAWLALAEEQNWLDGTVPPVEK